MAAGFVSKTVGDGNGGTFVARFWSLDTSNPSSPLYPVPVITDSAGADAVGQVTATPTANTILGRLKDLQGGRGAGAVDATVERVTLASDDPAVAALVAIRDAANTVNTAADSSVLYVGSSAKTPKFKSIDATASGATTVVAAVATKKIRVLAAISNTDADCNVKLLSHTTTATATALKRLKAGAGFVLPFNEVGWFETVAGEALDINLSATANVGIDVVYIEV